MSQNSFLLGKERNSTTAIGQKNHLNNAGAALPNERTLAAQIDYLVLESKIGGYEAATAKKDIAQAFYENVSQLLRCGLDEVAFVDSATRAWNTFLYSIPFSEGDKIITTSLEFGSNVVSLQDVSNRYNLDLIVVETNGDGEQLCSDITDELDEQVRLVAITHAPAHCGTVQDVGAIGRLLSTHKALYLVDACQTVGQFDLDVTAIGCDALVATGRKWLRGPRGTGFLYVSNNVAPCLNSVSIDLANTDWIGGAEGAKIEIAETAKKFEIWERSIAGQIGLSQAVKYYNELDKKGAIDHMARLRSLLRSSLATMPSITLYHGANCGSNVVTFYHKETTAADIKTEMEAHNVNISVIHDWDAPWDFEQKKLPPMVRVSPHYYNTVEEIESFVEKLERLV